jgi:ribosomal-protein-alanine N-acetyltransferase
MTSQIPFIHTAHLTLRPFLPEDAAVLLLIYQSEGVLRYFPNPAPPPLEKVQRFVAGQAEHWEKHGCGDWAVVVEDEEKLIGWAGLQYLPELDETEVGFLLDRPFWGKGYATEAARVSVQFGFELLNLDHIIALVHPDNIASRRVIEKCGLGFEESLSLWGIQLRRYQINNISTSK